MPTTVTIPQPIRADVDHEASPHVFAEVTAAPMTRVEWNDNGELEVDFDGDLTTAQVNEVIRIARDQPMLFDPDGPPLPGQLIPDEGWEYSGPIAPENIVTGTLQSKVQIGEELWAVRYADPTDPDSPPDPESAVISITADDGIRLQTPTGPLDETGEPTLVTQVHLPTYLADENGERITARLSGIADLARAETRQLTIDGSTDDGHLSMLASGARLQLNNAVADPDEAPQVQFVPRTGTWPTSTKDWVECGWGRSGTNIVYAVRHATAGTTRFRFVNAATGAHDHDADTPRTFDNIAGFTATGSSLYVFGRRNGSWRIHRFNLNGDAITSADASGIARPWLACLGTLDGQPCLVARNDNDYVYLYRYDLDLSTPSAYGTDYQTTRTLWGFDATSADGGWLWNGSRIARLDPFDGTRFPFNLGQSFWSGIGVAAGGGTLSNGEPATLDGQGTIARYNSDAVLSTRAWFAVTRWRSGDDTESAPSPVVSATWPSRMFAVVQGPAPVSGTDGIRFYGSLTEPATATDLALQGSFNDLGAAVITLDKIGAGVSPPATSEFTSATSMPAEIVSQGKIPGTSRPAVSIGAQGDAELYGLRHSFASRYRALDLTVPHASQTDLSIGSEIAAHPDIVYDSSGGLTVLLDGRYLLICQASWDSATGGYRTLNIRVNGTNRVSGRATGGSYTATVATRTLRLRVGDRITTTVYQSSGSPLAVRGGESETYIELTRLGV